MLWCCLSPLGSCGFGKSAKRRSVIGTSSLAASHDPKLCGIGMRPGSLPSLPERARLSRFEGEASWQRKMSACHQKTSCTRYCHAWGQPHRPPGTPCRHAPKAFFRKHALVHGTQVETSLPDFPSTFPLPPSPPCLRRTCGVWTSPWSTTGNCPPAFPPRYLLPICAAQVDESLGPVDAILKYVRSGLLVQQLAYLRVRCGWGMRAG